MCASPSGKVIHFEKGNKRGLFIQREKQLHNGIRTRVIEHRSFQAAGPIVEVALPPSPAVFF